MNKWGKQRGVRLEVHVAQAEAHHKADVLERDGVHDRLSVIVYDGHIWVIVEEFFIPLKAESRLYVRRIS